MDYSNLKLEKQGHIRLITFNHPPANAWNLEATQEFAAVVDEVAQDREARVMVLTGAGKCFSAGFDVSDSANAAQTSPMARALWTRIDNLDKPVIAAIGGHALGGGLELALCCHFRLAADDPGIKIGLTELNLGIIPGWGGTQRLPRQIGRGKALDMILFSRTLNPREALEIGLVDSLSPPEQLLADAMDLAQRLAVRPPVAVSCVLKAMSVGREKGEPEGLAEEERGSLTVRDSRDCVEGFTAFLEKRKPVFTGE